MKDECFLLNLGTKIIYSGDRKPILHGIEMLSRDIKKVCDKNLEENTIVLEYDPQLAEEEYFLEICQENMRVVANSDLGFVYGLLRISRDFLHIPPFWFWMELEIEKKDCVEIEAQKIESPEYAVKYRGWFFNDEVLMLGWKYNDQDKIGWRMCFEALLRCGGNMTIPGTDRMARENASLATEYGLILTHHHAEPLGTEMFLRKYPDLNADYFSYPELFQGLWREAVNRQKDYRVVWNLCFRGQGDYPFWADDKEGKYDTDEKRGAAISEIIGIQAAIVKEVVEKPVFCINLYGEIMELYDKGFIHFPEGTILVKADNGFGKMVTRRQGEHNPRVDAMPKKNIAQPQGIYYHVSFYDLLAANQMSMFPNSVEFVDRELTEVLENGGKDFWVINCSNVKPHTFFLDLTAKKWLGRGLDGRTHAMEFVNDYFNGDEEVANAYLQYHEITPRFGDYEDEHCGEQFYTENVRYLAHYAILGQQDRAKELVWLTENIPFSEQIAVLEETCAEKIDAMENFLASIPQKASLLRLHALMHRNGALGIIKFKEAYEAFLEEDYRLSFELAGDCAHLFEEVDLEMKRSAKGIWESFYDNDCQADFKFSAYQVRKFMAYIRELGDNPAHYRWQWDYLYEKQDREVHLILLNENHATDEEIYQKMKEQK